MTTGHPWIDVVIASAAVVSALTAVLFRPARSLWRLFRRVDAFLEDWNGEPARPGREKQPGVMERLEVIEDQGATTERRVDLIEQHLGINLAGG